MFAFLCVVYAIDTTNEIDGSGHKSNLLALETKLNAVT